jgi:hypothetical protein
MNFLACAGSQLLILKDEQSGLLTHGYGKRFIIRADEILTAFVELQTSIHEFAVSGVVTARAEACVPMKS